MKILIEDTRNQIGKHKNINDQLTALGWAVEREALGVGDYALPLDRSVVIDTKKDMQEVYSNVVQDHKRFRAECVRAQTRGMRLIVLIEEKGLKCVDDVSRWQNRRYDRYWMIKAAQKNGKMQNVRIGTRSPVKSSDLAKKMKTMTERYGVQWEFCEKKDTGMRILELLGVNICEEK